jgi:DNA repair protein RecO
MQKHATLEGVVIKMFNAKDADRVIHLVLEDGSKLAVVAQGVKKATSRKAHAIDLLNKIQIKLTRSKGSLESISEVRLLNAHRQFKTDYAGLIFCQAICEVVGIFVQEQADESAYFRNLTNLLEVKNSSRLGLLLAGFILRYLNISGDLPRLNEDVFDNNEIEQSTLRYPTSTIGYTTEARLATGEAVSDRILKTQRFILNYDFSSLQQLKLEKNEEEFLLDLHIGWLRALTNNQLPACTLLSQTLKTNAKLAP